MGSSLDQRRDAYQLTNGFAHIEFHLQYHHNHEYCPLNNYGIMLLSVLIHN